MGRELLEMLEDAVQGWLEVASQQSELAPDRQLIPHPGKREAEGVRTPYKL